MAKFQNVAHRTLIIAPGSTVLRLGIATEERPTSLLHCIARQTNSPDSCKFPQLLSDESAQYYEAKSCDYCDMFGTLETGSQTVGDNLLSLVEKALVRPDSDGPSQPDFIPFQKLLKMDDSSGYEVQWPIVSGRFNPSYSQSLNLKNLEDLWCFALQSYCKIAKRNFPQYSVILLIEDIYTRKEIREIVNMLFLELKFDRVMVHQKSVCAVYGVGIPIACVVDLGFQKTTISCIDQGVSLSEVRVNLPVGVSDCLQLLRSALRFYSEDDTHLTNLLEKIDRGSLEDLELLVRSLFDGDKAVIAKMKNHSLRSLFSEKLHFELGRGSTVSLPVSALLASHLAPYFFPSRGELTPAYQVPGIEAPEPDDPFDDMYAHMNARERKRAKLQVIEGVACARTVDDARYEARSPSLSRPASFKDLTEAIVWSINQSPIAAALALEAEATSTSDVVIEAQGDQLKQNLLGCILLVGGGATGLSGFLLKKLLAYQLHAIEGTNKVVEVFTQPQGVSELSWTGAKVMLNSESVSDLYIFASEWAKYGSRILREKAPFIW